MVLRQITKLNLDSIPLASFQIKKKCSIKFHRKILYVFFIDNRIIRSLKKDEKNNKRK